MGFQTLHAMLLTCYKSPTTTILRATVIKQNKDHPRKKQKKKADRNYLIPDRNKQVKKQIRSYQIAIVASTKQAKRQRLGHFDHLLKTLLAFPVSTTILHVSMTYQIVKLPETRRNPFPKWEMHSFWHFHAS